MTYKEKAIAFLVETKLGCRKLRDKELSDVCDISIKAIEKQLPKKVKEELSGIDNQIDFLCPECNSYFLDRGSYCSSCGQALDWSDKE